MPKIYLIRHCVAKGQEIDAALTDKGKNQSYLLANLLDDKEIECLISSHFLRAQQTILPLSKRMNIPITIDKRLGERILSSESLPNWYECLKQTYDDETLKFKGGESVKEATDRAIRSLQDILASKKEVTAVVTHGGLLSLILKYYDSSFGFAEWEQLTNPDVYCLTYDIDDIPTITRIWEEKDVSIS